MFEALGRLVPFEMEISLATFKLLTSFSKSITFLFILLIEVSNFSFCVR